MRIYLNCEPSSQTLGAMDEWFMFFVGGSFLFKEIAADGRPRGKVYYSRSRERWIRRPGEMELESGLWQLIGMDSQNGPSQLKSEHRSAEVC